MFNRSRSVSFSLPSANHTSSMMPAASVTGKGL
jgi:hypothetical protein